MENFGKRGEGLGFFKKLVAGVVITSLVGVGAWQGISYMQKSNVKEVYVVKVESIEETYYSEDTSITGNITTNISQNISFDRDVIVLDLPVSKGDHVKKGDTLITFDMTLAEMELNIAKLKRQLQEVNLVKAQNRLYSLQNGGSILETDADGFAADNLSGLTTDSRSVSSTEETGFGGFGAGSAFLAAVFPRLLAADILTGNPLYEEGDGEEYVDGDLPYSSPDTDQEFTGSDYLLDPETAGGILDNPARDTTSGGDILTSEPDRTQNSADISGPISYLIEDNSELSGGDGPDEHPLFITPTPGGVTPTPKLLDPNAQLGLTDGQVPFHQVLYYNTEPYSGTGTKEDPYLFFCSGATGKITLTGSFLNRMAGYSEDGGMLLNERGYWYLLEFHLNDTVSDFTDRKSSSNGYFLIDGGLLSRPVNAFSQMTLEQSDAYVYEDVNRPHEEDDSLPDDDSGGDSGESTLSRADAIRIQQKTIQTLKLSIRESDIRIAKLEQKIALKEIVAKIDGTVAYTGDPVTGNYSGDAFLKVKSKEGFFVRGTVSELMLDDMKVGTKLDCQSYTTGSFVAEVLEVSDYPVSGSDGGWYGMQNPNASNYLYTARIEDQSLGLTDMDYVQVKPRKEKDEAKGIILERAFILTENGNNYVYKAENGFLKKSIVRVGSIVNMGYSVMITGGLKRDDWIAFPYGDAKDGVIAKEGSVTDLYDW